MKINGTSVTLASDGTFSKSVSLSAGANTITIVATDTPGNTATTSRSVTRATSGPSTTISSPASGAVIRSASVTVSGNVSDSVSPVSSVTVNGTAAAIANGTYSATVSLSEGSNTLTVVAQNQVGLSTTVTRSVTRDMTGPTVTWTAPANGLITAASSVTVSGKVTDIHGVSSVTVNGTAVTVASDGTFSRTVNLSGGTNTITIAATDTPGNTTTVSRSVTRATSGPALTITSPTAGTVLKATTVTISGTVSDSVSTVSGVTINGAAATVSGGTYTGAAALTEGNNTVTVVASNAVGLTTTKTVLVVRDMTAPSLSVTSPANNLITAAGSVTVSGTVSDAHLSGVTVNGTAVTVSSGSWSTTVNLNAGSNTITVVASDTVGNSSTITRTVKRETQGPNLAITSPTSGYLTKNSTVTVTGTVAANISPVKSVSVNGVAATISGSTFTATISLTEGVNTITVIGANQVNLTTTKAISITRDSTPPVIALTAPTAGQIVSSASFVVTGTVSDDRSGVAAVTVNGGAATISNGAFSRTITLTEGANAVTAVAADQAGNTATVTGSVVLDTIPPELTVTYPAGDLITNQPQLTVTGMASDANLSGVTVNGSATTLINGRYSKTLTLQEGSNTITVTASDRAGHTTTVRRSVFLDTVKPVLTLVSPPEGWLTTNKPTIVFEAADEAGGSGLNMAATEVTVDGAQATATVSGSTITLKPTLPDGLHVITVTVQDRAGNVRGLSASYGVDTIPPKLVLTLPDSHRVVDSETIPVVGQALDSGSGPSLVVIAVNGVERWRKAATEPGVNSLDIRADIPLEIAANDIKITATDGAGLTTIEQFRVIRLVTDRTKADLDKLQDLFVRGLDNWMEEERAWFASTLCHRGGYDDLDVNRVELAMDWIGTWLHGYGNFEAWDPPLDWTAEEAMRLLDADRYLNRVRTLRGAMAVPDGTPETPETMRDVLTLSGANDLEMILVAVDSLRPLLEKSWWYSGEIFCGEV